MVVIYWRFNRDRASLLQTFSYWGIFLVFVVTQRLGMIIERTDFLLGTAIRFLILAPVCIFGAASRNGE